MIIGEKQFTLPFDLPLNKEGTTLECHEVLRFIPGRRAVFSGNWNGCKIVAKFFFKPFRYKTHVKKELEGNALLQKAGVPTVSIVHSEFCTGINAHLLIFKFISSSSNLEKIFKSRFHSKSDKQYLILLIQLIARMHETGILHNDLHPNNFLLKDEMIYALDGAAVEQISDTPLKKDVGLKNLSILLAQINITGNDLFYNLIEAYAERRNFKNVAGTAGKLEKLIAKNRKQMTDRYLKKIYRNSTQVVSRTSFSSSMLCRRKYYTPEMASFLKNPDVAFHDPGRSILKAGNSATVIRHNIDGIEIVVKRYNMKNSFHAMRRAFKKTRADISWRSAHLLIKNRINTSKPIAMKEKRFGPFRNKAFFVCEYIKGEDVRQYLLKAGVADASHMAEEIISLFTRLKSLMISHGDMKFSNIIIQNEEPFLIDLDSMAMHKLNARFFYAHKKDVNRFLKNWQDHPEILNMFNRLHP